MPSSPEVLRTSTAAALSLRLAPGRFSRDVELGGINVLLDYERGCHANCAYCGLARERPGAYARSVLVNRRRSLLRRSVITQKHAELLRSEAYAPDFGEEGIVLWQAIRSLPKRQRAALVLRFYEDLPEAEIARILNAPVGTVKSLVHRGLGKLRDRVGSELGVTDPRSRS